MEILSSIIDIFPFNWALIKSEQATTVMMINGKKLVQICSALLEKEEIKSVKKIDFGKRKIRAK